MPPPTLTLLLDVEPVLVRRSPRSTFSIVIAAGGGGWYDDGGARSVSRVNVRAIDLPKRRANDGDAKFGERGVARGELLPLLSSPTSLLEFFEL